MDFQVETKSVTVNCGERLDLSSIEDQKAVLAGVLAAKKTIIFLAKDLSQIDAAALQLLLCVTEEASRQNIQWQWLQPSKALIQVASLLGLNKILGLPAPK